MFPVSWATGFEAPPFPAATTNAAIVEPEAPAVEEAFDGLERLELYAREQLKRAEANWLGLSFNDEPADSQYATDRWREMVRQLEALRAAGRLARLLRVDCMQISFRTRNTDLNVLCDATRIHAMLMQQLLLLEQAYAEETKQAGVPSMVKAEPARLAPLPTQPPVIIPTAPAVEEEEQGSGCTVS